MVRYKALVSGESGKNTLKVSIPEWLNHQIHKLFTEALFVYTPVFPSVFPCSSFFPSHCLTIYLIFPLYFLFPLLTNITAFNTILKCVSICYIEWFCNFYSFSLKEIKKLLFTSVTYLLLIFFFPLDRNSWSKSSFVNQTNFYIDFSGQIYLL